MSARSRRYVRDGRPRLRFQEQLDQRLHDHVCICPPSLALDQSPSQEGSDDDVGYDLADGEDERHFVDERRRGYGGPRVSRDDPRDETGQPEFQLRCRAYSQERGDDEGQPERPVPEHPRAVQKVAHGRDAAEDKEGGDGAEA